MCSGFPRAYLDEEPIVMTNRFCILILWLAAASATAAPLANDERHRNPNIEPSTASADHTPKTLDRPASTEENEDTLMRRLRVIVDELKQQGPPPVGCMEG